MKIGITLASLLLAFLGTSVFAADLTDAGEIVKKANHTAFYQGDDGRAETRMKIVDGNGREQIRQFTIIRKDITDGGDQLFYVLFSRPSDVKRTAFLVKKHVGNDDDRWLYLPSLDLVKRISAGDKRTSFVGSNFFYEDVSGRGLDEDTHKLLETTDKYYVVDNTPKNPGEVEFKHYKVWIDKTNFVPEKTEYYNQQEKLYRKVSVAKIETIDGFTTATRMRVDDLNSGGYTLSEMRFIHYNLNIPADIFTERSLRTPPQQWLKGGK